MPEDLGSDDDRVFFSEKENIAIGRCNIKVDGQGRYSQGSMSEAIARLQDLSVVEAVEPAEDGGGGGPSRHAYEMYCVKKKRKKAFFNRDIYNVHGENGHGYSVAPSEETILLEIEVIRRSSKGIKSDLFRKKEMGGMVVFGPWWNYALMRLLELSSDRNVDKESLGDYTAVKILLSLFAMIKDNLNDVVKKPGEMKKLNDKFGVDWVNNAKIARRVINRCRPLYLVEEELSAVEAHVEALKSKAKPARSKARNSSSGSFQGSANNGTGGGWGRTSNSSSFQGGTNTGTGVGWGRTRETPSSNSSSFQGHANNRAGGGWGRTRDGPSANNGTGGGWGRTRDEPSSNSSSFQSGADNETGGGWGRTRDEPSSNRFQGGANNGTGGGWGRSRDEPSSNSRSFQGSADNSDSNSFQGRADNGTGRGWSRKREAPSSNSSSFQGGANNGTGGGWGRTREEPSSSTNSLQGGADNRTDRGWGGKRDEPSSNSSRAQVSANNGPGGGWGRTRSEASSKSSSFQNGADNETRGGWGRTRHEASSNSSSFQGAVNNGTDGGWGRPREEPSSNSSGSQGGANNGTGRGWGQTREEPSSNSSSFQDSANNGTGGGWGRKRDEASSTNTPQCSLNGNRRTPPVNRTERVQVKAECSSLDAPQRNAWDGADSGLGREREEASSNNTPEYIIDRNGSTTPANPTHDDQNEAGHSSSGSPEGSAWNGADDGWGRKRKEASSNNTTEFIIDRNGRPPPHNGTYVGQFQAGHSSSDGPQANACNGADNGWGQKRDEPSSTVRFKTKSSWKFARRTLSCSIRTVISSHQETMQHDPAIGDRISPAPPVMSSRGVSVAQDRSLAMQDNLSRYGPAVMSTNSSVNQDQGAGVLNARNAAAPGNASADAAASAGRVCGHRVDSLPAQKAQQEGEPNNNGPTKMKDELAAVPQQAVASLSNHHQSHAVATTVSVGGLQRSGRGRGRGRGKKLTRTKLPNGL